MAKLNVGDRVKILSGMSEFVGKIGTIVDDNERDGRTKLYRVELDEPVKIDGVGMVTDDLWAAEFLEKEKSKARSGGGVKFPEVSVKLTGGDGNAFAILGAVEKAMRRANVPKAEIEAYMTEAMSGDYNKLLAVTMRTVNVS